MAKMRRPKKSITGKQRAARKRNIKIARQAKSKGGGMSDVKKKFIKGQSQKTIAGWISNAKKRGDTKSVKELTPFLKKKRSDAAFRRRGRFLASRIK